MFGPCELRTLVEAETDVRVRCTSTNLASLDTTCGMYCDLQDTDSRINWGAGQHLLQVQCKDWIFLRNISACDDNMKSCIYSPFGSYIIGPRVECTMSRMNVDRPGICEGILAKSSKLSKHNSHNRCRNQKFLLRSASGHNQRPAVARS